jgi:ABC-type bacteriocin/lantibiotic exporter with double-glycine peptidase domain
LGETARFGAQEILLAAKSLGFKARAATLSLKDIDNTILPALGRDISGQWFILARSSADSGQPSAIAKEAAAAAGGETKYLLQQLVPVPA